MSRFYQTVYDPHLPDLCLEGQSAWTRAESLLQRMGARLGIRTSDALARGLARMLQQDMGMDTLLLWVRRELVVMYNLAAEEAAEVARKLHWGAPAEERTRLGVYLHAQVVRADVVAKACAACALEAGLSAAEAAARARRIFPAFAWDAPPLSDQEVLRIREERLMRKVLLRERGYEQVYGPDAYALRRELDARLAPFPPKRTGGRSRS